MEHKGLNNDIPETESPAPAPHPPVQGLTLPLWLLCLDWTRLSLPSRCISRHEAWGEGKMHLFQSSSGGTSRQSGGTLWGSRTEG